LRETLPVLVDQAVVDPSQIAEVVGSVEGVESFHRVRSRGAEGSAMVDLHVRIAPSKTVQEADAIASEIRRRLLALEMVTDVTVHLEAQHSQEADGADILATLKHIADSLGVTIHESWAHRLEGGLYVDVHVGVNPRLTIGEAHALVDSLEVELRSRSPEVRGVHTHIEMADLHVQEGDRASEDLEERVRREVEKVVAGVPGLVNPHNVVVRHNRDEGQQYYISLECHVAPDLPVGEAHRLSHLLEQELKRRLTGAVDVFVHLEPVESAEE
jgi:divalent metal cation (Fe/Co/Zn/Cd) transporter